MQKATPVAAPDVQPATFNLTVQPHDPCLLTTRVSTHRKRNGSTLMPKVDDDGSMVTVDLHGLTVDEAIDVTYQTVRLAQDRGRASVKLIHGWSTTKPGRRTIKTALHDLLDEGMLGASATNVIRSRSHIVLSLDLTVSSDPTRINLSDVW